MSKVNIVSVCIAGKFSYIKRLLTTKDFNILSKMTAVLETPFFSENKKGYKMFEGSKYVKNVKRKLHGVCLPFFKKFPSN